MKFNEVHREIEARLSRLPEPWKSQILVYAEPLLESGATIDRESNAILLGPRPDMGSQNYAITLFPPATLSDLSAYEQQLEVQLPEAVKAYLQAFNGARLFEFQVCGADLIYAHDIGAITRTHIHHCADIGTDLVVRRRSNAGALPIIGARNTSLDEVHRFVPSGTGVLAISLRGEAAASWSDYESWFSSQAASAFEFTGVWRTAMSALLKEQ